MLRMRKDYNSLARDIEAEIIFIETCTREMTKLYYVVKKNLKAIRRNMRLDERISLITISGPAT